MGCFLVILVENKALKLVYLYEGPAAISITQEIEFTGKRLCAGPMVEYSEYLFTALNPLTHRRIHVTHPGELGSQLWRILNESDT